MQLVLPEPDDDGLFIPEVKPHSRQKHHFLRRYLHAVSTAMRDKFTVHYIDLFAGAGIERIEGNGLDWGSPLIAAQMPHRFARLHLCEDDPRKFNALQKRLRKFPQPMDSQLLNLDANQACLDIVNAIPQRRTLTLAFLDPYGLHLHFSTVRQLSSLKADLIIFFPDHLDALRNWSAYYLDQDSSNLDHFLGRDDWRQALSDAPKSQHAEILRKLYEQQLQTLGFNHFDYRRVSSVEGRPLYRLIFASGHERGLQIWRNVSKKGPGEQYGLF
jgi:three-Cys-motif partner protein